MNLSASLFYERYRPSDCALRPRLHHDPTIVVEARPDAFMELLLRLGNAWEERHLVALEEERGPAVRIPKEGDYALRREQTRQAVRDGAPLVYQPMLFGHHAGDAINGIPDLLIREGDGYVVRDVKLARRLDGRRDIALQLGLYSWLYAEEYGEPPVRLEVALGTGELAHVPDDGGAAAVGALEQIRQSVEAVAPAYEPVGWSKCGGCTFKPVCWDRALREDDVAALPDVDQGLARQLHQDGVATASALLSTFDVVRLAELRRPRGSTMARVGTAARSIMRHARARREGRPLHIARFPLTLESSYVMFDLEGVPPDAAGMSEWQKIYLWGMQVFGPGEAKEPFSPAVAPFGDDGDQAGWEAFLATAKSIMDAHPGIRFVHWATYERTAIRDYIARYGDPDGVAGRVLESLEDLLPITKRTVVVDAPSYSLKVIEGLAGFERTQDEYGGQWSIAKYIEAVETKDAGEYERLLEQVLTYNREDLEATWAVLRWLASRFGGAPTDA